MSSHASDMAFHLASPDGVRNGSLSLALPLQRSHSTLPDPPVHPNPKPFWLKVAVWIQQERLGDLPKIAPKAVPEGEVMAEYSRSIKERPRRRALQDVTPPLRPVAAEGPQSGGLLAGPLSGWVFVVSSPPVRKLPAQGHNAAFTACRRIRQDDSYGT